MFWNRRYAPAHIASDRALKSSLRKDGLIAESFDGFLLHEPSRIATQSGDFYKVYTPFYKRIAADGEPRDPVDAPNSRCAAWAQTPTGSNRSTCCRRSRTGRVVWRIDGSRASGAQWIASKPSSTNASRDIRKIVTCRASTAHRACLRIWRMARSRRSRSWRRCAGDRAATPKNSARKLPGASSPITCCFTAPTSTVRTSGPNSTTLDGEADATALKAWQRGQTGYPIVDAGMRELWQTGWMHNRVRMIVASFLVKHLLIDWREGEAWFWDTLVDADPANNPASWQWVAGSGADAAPYFRIFNPIAAGREVRSGRQLRPALRARTREASRPLCPSSLGSAAVFLARQRDRFGKDYPLPIVDHAKARDRAMAAYRATRGT